MKRTAAVRAELVIDVEQLLLALQMLRQRLAPGTGAIRFLDPEGDVLAFVREGEGEKLLCAFNFGDGEARWPLPDGLGPVKAVDYAGYGAALQGSTLSLPGLRAFIGQIG